MEKGSIVMVNFTGREVSTGKVYDTTDEKVAKETGLFKEDGIYRAVPVIVGKGELLKGLDEVLERMKEGEEKVVALGPEKAFGERKKELVRILPLQEFVRRKVHPFPGLVVDVNGMYGKVQTISGGRVRVDFNSDLAGKTVEYKIKVEKELKTVDEKVQALAEKYFPLKEGKASAVVEGNKVVVSFEKELPKGMELLKEAFKKVILENIATINEVEYKEPAKKEESKKEEKTEEKAEKAEKAQNKP